MASLIDNSRVVKSFLPSLSHFAAVKVAISLLNAFDGVDTCSRIKETHRNSEAFIEFYGKNGKGSYEKRVKNWSFIPGHLRKEVLKTIHGLGKAIDNWEFCHLSLLQLIKDYAIVFQWRSDGTIDTLKTIQQLVLDETIDIRKLFKIACWYCEGESIQTLWAKMKLTDQTENFDGMERFWVKWIHDGSGIPSTQAALDCFNQNKNDFAYSIRYSSFFPFLKPEDRLHLLSYLELAKGDDLRQCLYSITREEEEQILNKSALNVLNLYFEWPFESLFLEIVEKMWSYIDESDFEDLLLRMFDLMTDMGDPYKEMFECFWNRSPSSLKESAKKDPCLRKKIDSYFESKREKSSLEAFCREQAVLEREFNSKTKRRRKGTRKNRKTHSQKSKKH